MRNLDRFEGCMIGGAAGDALGYAIEFNDLSEIKEKYGENGITEFDLHKNVAPVSDDTQMSLFTATGLLAGTYARKEKGEDRPYRYYINRSYKDWYRTQIENYPLCDGPIYSWLSQVSEMFADRSPGTSCMSALRKGGNGTMDNPVNDSKGCGGIMRVAPVALYFLDKKLSVEEVDMMAAEAAALTHGHSLGYMPAAALAHIIYLVAGEEEPSLKEAVDDMKDTMKLLFEKEEELPVMIELIEKAEQLAYEGIDDVQAISRIGEGWVAEETLAIGIYCALKYEDDFEKAVIAAVNHRGDSDSTGAVTGNIMGALMGINKIPEKFIEDLELKDIILELASDLCYENLERYEELYAGGENE